jgi:hypothetical protein
MAEAKDCPKCGLANPPEAQRCDCGWDFVSLRGSRAGADQQRRRRVGYIAGIVGFAIMSIQGLVSTLNPKPDGRVLNTAPALGVDLFLFVGLLGIAYCVVQLVRDR